MGEIPPGKRSRQGRVNGFRIRLRTVQISLISEVVGTYFLLLDYHQRLEISRRTLDSRLKSLKIIQLRFDYGIVPELDVNQAQI